MAEQRTPGTLGASRGNSDLRDGTLQLRPGMTPGVIGGPVPGNTGIWGWFDLDDRVSDLIDALNIGKANTLAAVKRMTDQALDDLIRALLPGLLTMIAVIGVTTVVGGAIGAVVGALVGAGVGAAPGAAAGVELGLSIGGAILTWMGLGFLLVAIGEGLGELSARVAGATSRAWNAVDSRDRSAEVHRAGLEFADAVALLFKIILMAIVARLTFNQGKAASKETFELLRKSRLGEQFAEWVMKNQEALIRNPKLQPAKPKASQGEAPVKQAETPSQVKKQAGKAETAEEAAKPGMKRKDVKCFKKNKKGDPAEYDRQLADQEKGLNELTVQEYMEGRKRYTEIGREGTGAAQKAARDKYSKELQAQFEKQLAEDGVFGDEATKQAAKMTAQKMETLAALHNPDMIAGGKDVVTSMGDKRVNSSIGSQWKNGVDERGRSRVQALDQAAESVPESARGTTKMNASLKRCK